MIVISDGLSAIATMSQAAPTLRSLVPMLASNGWRLAQLVVVKHGRVAIQDEVGSLLNALFYIAASKITSVKEPHRLTMELEQSSTKAEVITGIEDVCRDFVQEARFPSDAGLGWAVRGGRADIGHLKYLRQSLDTIRANPS